MMRKLILVSLFLFINIAAAYPYSGGHDSLLFDGTESISFTESTFSDDCMIKVTKVSGFVIGSKTVREIFDICGQPDTINRVESAAQLKVGDNLMRKEEIKTGEDGFAEMELTDGSIIRVGPNSTLYVDEEMCSTARALIRIGGGSLWFKIKKLLGGGKFEVSTYNGGGGVRGTEFTYEVLDGKDIIKVYEGSFEVNPPKDMSDLESSAKQMEQLQKDYEAGKLTTEEFTTKLLALSQQASQQAGEIKPTLVEAGYMVTLTNKIGTPEPIPSGETKWFEDAKFK